MAISEFATYMNPLISALRELGGSARADEVCSTIAERLDLPDSVLDKQLKNGESRFKNQVHWARFYLASTGYLDSSKRGVWALTEKGQTTPTLSEEQLREIIQKVQSKTPKQKEIKFQREERDVEENNSAPLLNTPEAGSREQLLNILKSLSPSGFERICQRLLREAGFEKVEVTGRSGDGVQPIELVDSEKLVEMFEQLELGMIPRTVYEVDESFFETFKN